MADVFSIISAILFNAYLWLGLILSGVGSWFYYTYYSKSKWPYTVTLREIRSNGVFVINDLAKVVKVGNARGLRLKNDKVVIKPPEFDKILNSIGKIGHIDIVSPNRGIYQYTTFNPTENKIEIAPSEDIEMWNEYAREQGAELMSPIMQILNKHGNWVVLALVIVCAFLLIGEAGKTMIAMSAQANSNLQEPVEAINEHNDLMKAFITQTYGEGALSSDEPPG